MTLRDLADRLASLDLDAVATAALAAQAELIADATRDALSVLPGGPHDYPWLRSGTLRDSIESEADAAGAVIASDDPVAQYQEDGTATIPPRPFFAPVAAAHAEPAAEAVGAAFADAIRQTISGGVPQLNLAPGGRT